MNQRAASRRERAYILIRCGEGSLGEACIRIPDERANPRVLGQDVRVEVTSAHQDDVAVLWDVAVSQPPQFHGRIMAGTAARGARRVPCSLLFSVV